MTIKDNREQYKVEIKIHPRSHRLIHCSHKYGRVHKDRPLDNRTFTHRADGRQPIEYHIEGLKYKKKCSESKVPRLH